MFLDEVLTSFQKKKYQNFFWGKWKKFFCQNWDFFFAKNYFFLFGHHFYFDIRSEIPGKRFEKLKFRSKRSILLIFEFGEGVMGLVGGGGSTFGKNGIFFGKKLIFFTIVQKKMSFGHCYVQIIQCLIEWVSRNIRIFSSGGAPGRGGGEVTIRKKINTLFKKRKL